MQILVILGHPQKGSFNHAIAETVVSRLKANGHDVVFHDHYEEGFDPVRPAAEIPEDGMVDELIKSHCAEISETGGL